MMDFLTCVEQTIADVYKVNSRNTLKEDKTLGRQEIRYKRSGKQLLYSFDVDERGNPSPFPFFKDYKGLKKVSDFVLFTNRQKDNKPFILIFELKKSKSPYKQLKATKSFCEFLIKRMEQAFPVNFDPEIRMIGLVEGIKTGTRIDDVTYNDGIFNTPLRYIEIAKLLK